jgi:hypothetical protein
MRVADVNEVNSPFGHCRPLDIFYSRDSNFLFDIYWTVNEAGVKYTMTIKRTTKADGLSAGSSVTRPRRAGATHSRKPASASKTSAPTAVIDQEAIAVLAYSYWEARGCQGGSPEEDWLRAEQELLSR